MDLTNRLTPENIRCWLRWVPYVTKAWVLGRLRKYGWIKHSESVPSRMYLGYTKSDGISRKPEENIEDFMRRRLKEQAENFEKKLKQDLNALEFCRKIVASRHDRSYLGDGSAAKAAAAAYFKDKIEKYKSGLTEVEIPVKRKRSTKK